MRSSRLSRRPAAPTAFAFFAGFIPFAQQSVRRYDTQTMKTPKSSQETRLIGAAEAFIESAWL